MKEPACCGLSLLLHSTSTKLRTCSEVLLREAIRNIDVNYHRVMKLIQDYRRHLQQLVIPRAWEQLLFVWVSLTKEGGHHNLPLNRKHIPCLSLPRTSPSSKLLYPEMAIYTNHNVELYGARPLSATRRRRAKAQPHAALTSSSTETLMITGGKIRPNASSLPHAQASTALTRIHFVLLSLPLLGMPATGNLLCFPPSRRVRFPRRRRHQSLGVY